MRGEFWLGACVDPPSPFGFIHRFHWLPISWETEGNGLLWMKDLQLGLAPVLEPHVDGCQPRLSQPGHHISQKGQALAPPSSRGRYLKCSSRHNLGVRWQGYFPGNHYPPHLLPVLGYPHKNLFPIHSEVIAQGDFFFNVCNQHGLQKDLAPNHQGYCHYVFEGNWGPTDSSHLAGGLFKIMPLIDWEALPDIFGQQRHHRSSF